MAVDVVFRLPLTALGLGFVKLQCFIVSASTSIVAVHALLQYGKSVQRLHAEHAKGHDGEKFNLFHLLGIGHLEVSTHSRILRDLLDPHGSHGQGAVFLKRFVARLGLPSFDFEKAEVTPEVGIGTVTSKSGGRLDLVISDGTKKLILIENKIFAAEQANWVSRYLNHAPSAKLVFLTLDGREPEDMEQDSRPTNLMCASYQTHITDWLQDCRKEATTVPLVRESISQYLHLVQELTQQNREPYMNKELVKAATDSREALDAYYALRNAERDVQAEIVLHLQERLMVTANKLGLNFQGSPYFDYSAKGSGFEFSSAELNTMPLRIRFEFDKSGYRDFAFGFVDDGKLPTEARELLKSLFAEAYESPRSNLLWPAWIYWSRYQNWSTVFADIRFGNFVNDVEKELTQLNEIVVRLRETHYS